MQNRQRNQKIKTYALWRLEASYFMLQQEIFNRAKCTVCFTNDFVDEVACPTAP